MNLAAKTSRRPINAAATSDAMVSMAEVSGNRQAVAALPHTSGRPAASRCKTIQFGKLPERLLTVAAIRSRLNADNPAVARTTRS